MQHLKSDLGHLERGSTVVVTLDKQANVLLMDAGNYRTYSSGRGGRYRYYGGLAKKSPARIGVPSSDHWYLAVDLGGYAGRVRAGVAVEPPPRGNLPEIRQTSEALRSIVRTRPEAPPNSNVMGGRVWDVFLSHASEDKAAVARPLADALIEQGVTVWLDELELKVGDSLRRKIDQGITSSRFGIVVLSPAFFAKGWTQYELDGLVTLSVAGQQSLLPIWHDVTHSEVMAQSASLADKVALRTSDLSVEEIAAQIAEVVLEVRE